MSVAAFTSSLAPGVVVFLLVTIVIALLGYLCGLNDPNAPSAMKRERSVLTIENCVPKILVVAEAPRDADSRDRESSTRGERPADTKSADMRERTVATLGIPSGEEPDNNTDSYDAPIVNRVLTNKRSVDWILNPWEECENDEERGGVVKKSVSWREDFEMRRQTWGMHEDSSP